MSEILEPGTQEWFDARCGRVGASRVYDATARQKNGKYYQARADYMAELAVERLTGIAAQHFVNFAMQWGIEKEPDAIAAYEYLFSVDVEKVGWVQHEEIDRSGATPDGRVSGTRILCEFKCPTSATHAETLLSKEIDQRYIAQMEWQLACCDWAEAVDFSTYDPRFPPELRLWTFRFMRDDVAIAKREADVRDFLAELDEMVAKLRAVGRMEKSSVTRYPLRFRLRCTADPRDDKLRACEFWLAVRAQKARAWLERVKPANVTDIKRAKR